MAGEDIDSFFRTSWSDKGGRDGVIDRRGGGVEFVGFSFGFRSDGSRFGDDFRGFEKDFFSAGALIEFNPVLTEPKADFFVTVLFFGRHLEEENFGFFAVVEVINDDISDFGDGTGANIAFDAVFIFIHDKEDVGAVKVLIIGSINIGDFGSMFGVEGNSGGEIEHFVTLTFEETVPIADAILEFGAAGNDKFFHITFCPQVLA